MSVSEWPVSLRGITESIVTTQHADGAWNVAALGLQAPTTDGDAGDSSDDADRVAAGERPVVARTWGETTTKQHFDRTGRGYVQFTSDPVDIVEAALATRQTKHPVLPSADAWAEVRVSQRERGKEGTTVWVDWALTPVETGTEARTVPTVNRGFNAVIEAAVATTRLHVPSYDTEVLRDRLDYFEQIVRRCGGPREQEALDRLHELRE